MHGMGEKEQAIYQKLEKPVDDCNCVPSVYATVNYFFKYCLFWKFQCRMDDQRSFYDFLYFIDLSNITL